jgi:lipid II:glycine glycyltransferase (peptidoglycan interpeptide bridge formation enzyme)
VPYARPHTSEVGLLLNVLATQTIDPITWDQFLERHPSGSIFHHSLWHNVIKKTYDYQPLYHVILDNCSDLRAAVSSVFVKSRLTGNRIISFPFSDYCDPLVNNDAELKSLLEALERSRSELRARYFELRCLKTHNPIGNSQVQPEYYHHYLSLNRTAGALFQSFHKNSIQRAIKKAQRLDLEIIAGENHSHLEAFYHLHLMTRKKQGVPAQPFRFFKNLSNAFTPKEMLTLLLARYQGKFIAGIIIMWFKETAYFQFGASNDNFVHLRANQWLMWEAIQQAQKRGCRRFDFGRTSSANEGLMQYKRRWGTHKTPLNYLRLPIDRKSWPLKETSSRHLLVRKLIALMPAVGIRIVGELLYKHLA